MRLFNSSSRDGSERAGVVTGLRPRLGRTSAEVPAMNERTTAAELDLRPLSWHEPYGILRDWSLRCLSRLAQGEPTGCDELMRLARYLPALPPPAAELQERSRQALRRLRLRAVTRLEHPLSVVLARRLPPGGWRRWLHRRPSAVALRRLPRPLWTMVGEMAWSSAAVTGAVARTAGSSPRARPRAALDLPGRHRCTGRRSRMAPPGPGLDGARSPHHEEDGCLTLTFYVEDEASAVLMEAFYRQLRQGAAAALRAAQLEVSRRAAWRSPYFWAAFKITGDSRSYRQEGHQWNPWTAKNTRRNGGAGGRE